MQLKRKLIKTAAGILSAAMLCLFGTAGYYSEKLPSAVVKSPSSELRFAEYPEISCLADPIDTLGAFGSGGRRENVTLSLFGAIPVKNISITETDAPVLAVGGKPFGIKLLMDGVMVTELGDIIDKDGKAVCPAEASGIEVGDIIKTANGEKISSNSRFQELIAESGGRDISITAERDGREFSVKLKPVFSDKNNLWRGGMWVRDSVAGIGTMTFINEKTGEFAGLGHPICDSDTGELVPISSGEAVPVDITSAKRGERGVPGELSGRFRRSAPYGVLERNGACGVYGRLNKEAIAELCEDAERYTMGYRQEIKTGAAEIFTTVNGDTPRKYSIEIESIDLKSGSSTKNMVIRITDKELLSATGGIIQGMSGSPVIQDRKLIGAVTHVFVADPTRGYAVFAENMIK